MVKSSCRKLQFNFRELHNLEWVRFDPLSSPECANICSRFAHAACYHKSGSFLQYGFSWVSFSKLVIDFEVDRRMYLSCLIS
ncbi:hypothetical protein D918_07507 [Trichuris suis]|nr:hypothetical protein D918_07507 [Trichuris suis]